jgi:hypothetical protein
MVRVAAVATLERAGTAVLAVSDCGDRVLGLR